MDMMSVDVGTVRSATSFVRRTRWPSGLLEGLVQRIAAKAAGPMVLVVSEIVTTALCHAVASAPWS